MNAPLLTVVTACYNHGQYLAECIASVKRQTEPNIEHIIVIDGATDNSLEVAMTASPDDWRIKVLVNPENRGLAASQNYGIAKASAPWILKVDADDYIAAEYAEKILAVAALKPQVNIIFSPCQHVGLKTHVYKYAQFHPVRMIDEFLIPGPAAFRKELWEAVGGYDETMRSAEDWDFYVRAQLAVGLTVHQLPAPLWYYRMHAGQRASAEGMAQVEALKQYWRGHTRESVMARSRSWGAFCAAETVTA